MTDQCMWPVRNQKLYLTLNDDQQWVHWHLLNKFDNRIYYCQFKADPLRFKQTIKKMEKAEKKKEEKPEKEKEEKESKKQHHVQILYQDSQIVDIHFHGMGKFTVIYDQKNIHPKQLIKEEEEEEEIKTKQQIDISSQEDMETPFNYKEEAITKKPPKGKVLHQQYDDLNPYFPVSYTNIFPYNALVAIKTYYEIKGEIKIGYGSGCFISPTIILTCAHNLFHYTKKVFYSSIEVIRSGYGTRKVIKTYLPDEYPMKVRNNQSDSSFYDYAILVVERNYKQMKSMNILKNFSENVIAEIPGYPKERSQKIAEKKHMSEDIPDYNTNCYKLKNARNKLELFQEHLIAHKISTKRGQSGSPVIIQLKKNSFYIVGIHIEDDQYNERNLALRLTPQVINRIIAWSKEAPIPAHFKQHKDTLIPEVQDYYWINNISPQDYGFSLLDIQGKIDDLMEKGKRLEEGFNLRKAKVQYGKLRQFKQQYKNDNIQTKLVEMNIKYASMCRFYQNEKRKQAMKDFERTKIKVPKDLQMRHYKKAKQCLKECEEEIEHIVMYLEYYQLLCKVIKKSIQFDEQGGKYAKHKTFQALLEKIKITEDHSLKKYSTSQQMTEEIIKMFNYLRYECYFKMGEAHADEQKRKFKNAYEFFTTAEQFLQQSLEPAHASFVDVQDKILTILMTQRDKVQRLFDKKSLQLTAISYIAKITQHLRLSKQTNETEIPEEMAHELEDHFLRILREKMLKQEMAKIEKQIDIILESPRVILKKAAKEEIMRKVKAI